MDTLCLTIIFLDFEEVHLIALPTIVTVVMGGQQRKPLSSGVD